MSGGAAEHQQTITHCTSAPQQQTEETQRAARANHETHKRRAEGFGGK